MGLRHQKLGRALALALAATILLTISGCGRDEEASYLILLNAQGGTLEQASGDTYTLTLTGVSDIAVIFADRPIRQAHVVHTEEFASSFDAAFGGDPPNAALSFRPDDEGTQVEVAVFTISDPRYDAAAETLAYSAAVIPLDAASDGVSTEGRPLSGLPTEFSHSSLFIDSTDVQITYVNNSLNTDSLVIFVFTKNLIPTFDVLKDG